MLQVWRAQISLSHVFLGNGGLIVSWNHVELCRINTIKKKKKSLDTNFQFSNFLFYAVHGCITMITFRVGDYVTVEHLRRVGSPDSEGGIAYVISANQTAQKCVVRHAIDRRQEEVDFCRMFHQNLMTTARQRRNDIVTRPSLLTARPNHHDASSLHFEAQELPAAAPAAPPRTLSAAEIQAHGKPSCSDLLHSHVIWGNKGGIKTGTESPLVMNLYDNRNNEFGWLRKDEALRIGQLNTEIRSKLADGEQQMVFSLRCMLSSPCLDMNEMAPAKHLAHAWGRTKRHLRFLVNKIRKKQYFVAKTKVRSDKGCTIFTSQRAQLKTFTPLNNYRKVMHRNNTNPLEKLNAQTLKENYEALSENEKQVCTNGSVVELNRAPFLKDEVAQALRLTGGSITWRNLEAHLASDGVPIVSHESLRKYCMTVLPGSSYKTNRMFPKLTRDQKEKRLKWTKGFWLFWNSAMFFNPGVQVILSHSDEKWFYAIVVRKNNKCVPLLGVFPTHHHQRHKSHIHKEQVIVTTAMAYKENDPRKGGKGIKVDCCRVGQFMQARRDTCHRVHAADGSYTMPAIPENRLRIKGNYYFESCEVTGSDEGTAKNPKFSLKKNWKDIRFPALDEMARKHSSENNNCRVVVRYQEDGAGPHQEGGLMNYLDSEFESRGWMRVPQPPQSPILNTKDACVFPSMSKRVIAEQGLALGGLSAEKEKLWNIITKVWNEFPLHVIARSYAAHPQFVNAVHSCEGGDGFTKDEKAMHVGARQHFVPVYDELDDDENIDSRGKPVGVVSVDCLDDIAHEVLEKRKLRYERPSVTDLDPSGFLNGQELRVIGEHVDPDTFDEWDTYEESVAGAMFMD